MASIQWEPDITPDGEVAILAHYDSEETDGIAVIGTITNDSEGGWYWEIEDENNSGIRNGWEATKRQAKAEALKWAKAWADEDVSTWQALIEEAHTND